MEDLLIVISQEEIVDYLLQVYQQISEGNRKVSELLRNY